MVSGENEARARAGTRNFQMTCFWFASFAFRRARRMERVFFSGKETEVNVMYVMCN